MKKLKKIAIMLIYPDGEVEIILITDKKFHIEYFREQMKKSSRLAKICSFANSHIEVSRALAENGVIEIFNLDILPIVTSPDYLDSHIPTFMINLPPKFESMEQEQKFYIFVENYPIDEVGVSQYDLETGEFLECTFNLVNNNDEERGK